MVDWVVDSSPLILLAKVGQLHLLSQLTGTFVVPTIVRQEVEAGSPDDPARRWLKANPITEVSVPLNPLVAAWDLGAGETAVLSYALAYPPTKAVIDDGVARRCARTLNIPLIGTLGIILQAKQEALIPEAKPILKQLIAYGFWIDESVIRRVLRATVNEDWL